MLLQSQVLNVMTCHTMVVLGSMAKRDDKNKSPIPQSWNVTSEQSKERVYVMKERKREREASEPSV